MIHLTQNAEVDANAMVTPCVGGVLLPVALSIVIGDEVIR